MICKFILNEHLLFFEVNSSEHFWVSPSQLSPRVAQGQDPLQDLLTKVKK